MAAPAAPLPTLDDLVRAVRSAALTAQRDLIATGGRRLSPPSNDASMPPLALDAVKGGTRVARVTLEIPVVIRERPGAKAWSGAAAPAPALALPELVLLTGDFHPTEPLHTLRVEVAGDELAIRALSVDGCSLLPAARDGGAP